MENIPDKFVVLNLSENHGVLTNDYKTIGNTTKTKLQSMPGNFFISNYYRTSDGYEVAPLNSLLICGTKGKSIEKTMEALDLQDKIAQIRQLTKSGLANGVYVIRVTRGDCEYTKKIIVKH
ncbi:MAG: hypothetical protein II752_00240 [Muribaculaceae bacterium]|nr:hypothetical protein [Muribaculaceae bacterium]